MQGLVSTRTATSLPFPDSRAGGEMLLSTDVQGWGFLKHCVCARSWSWGISKTTRTPKVFLFPQVIFTDSYCIRKQNKKKERKQKKNNFRYLLIQLKIIKRGVRKEGRKLMKRAASYYISLENPNLTQQKTVGLPCQLLRLICCVVNISDHLGSGKLHYSLNVN